MLTIYHTLNYQKMPPHWRRLWTCTTRRDETDENVQLDVTSALEWNADAFSVDIERDNRPTLRRWEERYNIPQSRVNTRSQWHHRMLDDYRFDRMPFIRRVLDEQSRDAGRPAPKQGLYLPTNISDPENISELRHFAEVAAPGCDFVAPASFMLASSYQPFQYLGAVPAKIERIREALADAGQEQVEIIALLNWRYNKDSGPARNEPIPVDILLPILRGCHDAGANGISWGDYDIGTPFNREWYLEDDPQGQPALEYNLTDSYAVATAEYLAEY